MERECMPVCMIFFLYAYKIYLSRVLINGYAYNLFY